MLASLSFLNELMMSGGCKSTFSDGVELHILHVNYLSSTSHSAILSCSVGNRGQVHVWAGERRTHCPAVSAVPSLYCADSGTNFFKMATPIATPKRLQKHTMGVSAAMLSTHKYSH